MKKTIIIAAAILVTSAVQAQCIELVLQEPGKPDHTQTVKAKPRSSVRVTHNVTEQQYRKEATRAGDGQQVNTMATVRTGWFLELTPVAFDGRTILDVKAEHVVLEKMGQFTTAGITVDQPTTRTRSTSQRAILSPGQAETFYIGEGPQPGQDKSLKVTAKAACTSSAG